MVKTVQLGLRIEKELLDRIEELADTEGIDRNIWIKTALALYVAEEEDGLADQAVNDYVNLRIDEKHLLEHAHFDKVPEDIKKARQTTLNGLSRKK